MTCFSNALGNGDIELAAIFSLETATAPYLKSETIRQTPLKSLLARSNSWRGEQRQV